jgi:hypothetical protein
MSVAEIKAAIAGLPPADIADLATWIADLDASAWDEQIARDVAASRFDSLRDRVRAQRDAGDCSADVPGSRHGRAR